MIEGASIEIICHATEDWERIKESAEKLFGVEFEEELLSGHWNNPILVLRAKLGKKEAKELLKKVKGIKPTGIEAPHVYFRLSKEALIDGRIEEGKDVKVVFTVVVFPKSEEKIREELKKEGVGLED